MTPECVNGGGASSLVRLAAAPRLESEVPLPDSAIRALEAWGARPGEILTVCDPQQTFYRARLSSLEPGRASVVPFEVFARPPESALAIEVYQALPQKERFELILQKLTEVGVARIVPYRSSRSISLEERDCGQKKSHRWAEVVLRASRQCRRARLPELFPMLGWEEAISLAGQADLKLMLYEGDAPWTLSEALDRERPVRIALLVGPEGGFTPAEVEQAGHLGFLPVSLGSRILRTETAAIVGAALVQFSLGDLG
ncbi:hypothetical protein DESUT3_18880 [Desulfuromonas versatilis]|uniref:Ribosomal RNA small subunit methyltransferase E n=1 Tax=Desulfuromonas versatilis TaxID=2802975 RepID=A0ABM8HVR9_9BACT|nr:RsmE family RNA methyltransferase [Desulfuromonas versatilis]BCR04819.1 hypothetical protein DESUT3_18880 [Desulfuromonas versatilis]